MGLAQNEVCDLMSFTRLSSLETPAFEPDQQPQRLCWNGLANILRAVDNIALLGQQRD